MKPLAVQALERIGKNWGVSSKTRDAHLQHTKDFCKFVANTFGLENIQNLKPGHVEAYVQHMKDDQLDNGTMCNRMAAVRELAKAIGKGNIVARENKEYGIARGSRHKPITANTSEIDRIRQTLVERANAGDRVAMMCHAAAELRDAFGLRAQESLMSSKVVDTVAGAALRIEGAKGGRPRDLRITNDAQQRAVQIVDQVSKALGSATGRIIPPEMSLEKAYNAQRTLWRELGGTKSVAAHMHAARHTTAQEMKVQGYFNGSHVPFGYRLEHTDIPARMGVKKLLVIDPLEAPIVKRIYDLYIERNLGVKGIASLLNEEGVTRRGVLWSNTSIYSILTGTVYMGEKLFNQRNWRTGEKKDEDEIVRIPVEPIVSAEVFELVREKLSSRSPKKSHPRRLSSPHLLTGVLRCGECGAAMTMATGKSNTYFYYRCTTRTKKHLDLCSSKMVPMAKLDSAVLSALADKVFTPERVGVLIRELKSRMRGDNNISIDNLIKQSDMVQFKLNNLYRSIEDGIQVDGLLKQRLEQLKQQEVDLSQKIAGYDNSPQAMVENIAPDEIRSFTAKLRERLLNRDTAFSKEYLKLLVREVELKENQATVRGSYSSLVGAIKLADTKNLSTSKEVLRFNGDWRARTDSNGRQPGSKPGTLSS